MMARFPRERVAASFTPADSGIEMCGTALSTPARVNLMQTMRNICLSSSSTLPLRWREKLRLFPEVARVARCAEYLPATKFRVAADYGRPVDLGLTSTSSAPSRRLARAEAKSESRATPRATRGRAMALGHHLRPAYAQRCGKRRPRSPVGSRTAGTISCFGQHHWGRTCPIQPI